MATQEVRMLVGIPGSGKSTWINQEAQYLEEENKTTCVISRDYIRFSMLTSGENYFANEKEVFNEFVRRINEAMELGIDVVFIDATHINPASRNKVLSRLLPDPSTDLILEVMQVPLQDCLERNDKREGLAHVPDRAILRMEKDFVSPTEEEFIKTNNYGFKNVTIKYHKGE